jgi:hypothetical protein
MTLGYDLATLKGGNLVTKNRGVGGSACVCLLVGLFLPWGRLAVAAPPPAPGDIVKVRAVLVSFDQPGRSIVYERDSAKLSARVRDDAMQKLAGMQPGQVLDLRMQIQNDEWPLVFDVKKPRNKLDYVLFVIGALIVQFIPAG